MTLEELIKILEKAPQNLKVPKGFNNPHSWRGSYDELAFEPVENVLVSEMLADAKSAVGKTYTGYKGGEFEMDKRTEVHVSDWGSDYDYMGEMLTWYMFKFKD